jgi:hypothetical protein
MADVPVKYIQDIDNKIVICKALKIKYLMSNSREI